VMIHNILINHAKDAIYRKAKHQGE
jgi:hypothetical protein